VEVRRERVHQFETIRSRVAEQNARARWGCVNRSIEQCSAGGDTYLNAERPVSQRITTGGAVNGDGLDPRVRSKLGVPPAANDKGEKHFASARTPPADYCATHNIPVGLVRECGGIEDHDHEANAGCRLAANFEGIEESRHAPAVLDRNLDPRPVHSVVLKRPVQDLVQLSRNRSTDRVGVRVVEPAQMHLERRYESGW